MLICLSFLRAYYMHKWGAQKTVTPNHSFASVVRACYMHKWGAKKTATPNHQHATTSKFQVLVVAKQLGYPFITITYL